MTLEELSVVFSADLAPFTAAANSLGVLLSGMSAQADQLAGRFEWAGYQAGEGLKDGLLSRQDAVISAARQVAQAAAAALQGALQIHSPSRLTYEAGKYFDEGMVQGILDGLGRVEAAAGNLGGQSFQALATPIAASSPSSLDQALSRIAITIPLEIDGYRLGVAAIDGINRVSLGAGRTELMI